MSTLENPTPEELAQALEREQEVQVYTRFRNLLDELQDAGVGMAALKGHPWQHSSKARPALNTPVLIYDEAAVRLGADIAFYPVGIDADARLFTPGKTRDYWWMQVSAPPGAAWRDLNRDRVGGPGGNPNAEDDQLRAQLQRVQDLALRASEEDAMIREGDDRLYRHVHAAADLRLRYGDPVSLREARSQVPPIRWLRTSRQEGVGSRVRDQAYVGSIVVGEVMERVVDQTTPRIAWFNTFGLSPNNVGWPSIELAKQDFEQRWRDGEELLR